MKEHLLLAKVQFKFFFLYFLISNLYCKDIYIENINDSIKEKLIIQEDSKRLDYTIKPGNVYNLTLYKLKQTNIKFEKESGNYYYLLVHLYPLECKIYLTDSNDNEDNIYRISNYNYYAFYSLIAKDDTLKIKPLIFFNFLILFT